MDARYNIKELRELLDAYKQTLDTTKHAEYCSELDVVEAGVIQFLKWLANSNAPA
ncbi:MAG: hypothetical protein PHQ40_15620 [Anaerolineaceae bacterium]|nr:hypothetical protein [Anaerolineaceae bacterium]